MLQTERDKSKLPHFEFVEVNAMKLAHPCHAYREILTKITGQTYNPVKAGEVLRTRFATPDPERPLLILLLDELDFLSTKTQVGIFVMMTHPKSKPDSIVIVRVI